MKEIQPIHEQLNRLENYLPFKERIDTTISQANVGWHIEHSLAVLDQILDSMKNSIPSEFRYQFHFWKMLIFLKGSIPRGKAKAPKTVRVEHPSFEAEAIKQKNEMVISKLNEVKSLDKNAFFIHPFFGKMNRKESIRMMYLHTDHHLKIIEDILKHKKSR